MASQLDIARATGISQSTISRVLTGRWHESKIAPKTAEQVLETARALGYRPNRAANIVFGRKTRLLAVILRSFHYPYLATVLDEINERATTDDLGVITAGLSRRKDPLEIVHLLQGYRPDAMIVVGTLDFSGWKEYLDQSRQKIIQIGKKSPVRGVVSCSAHEQAGADMLIEHLFGMGHRHLAFVMDRTRASVVRLEALQNALFGRGVTMADGTVLKGCELSGELEEDEFDRLRAGIVDGSVTAVICAGDMIAAGLARRLMQAGIRIPQEVSLASYNDVPMAAMLNPSLTTVHLPVRELAGAAMDMATGRRAMRSVQFKPSLVVRESTAPPGS